MSLCRKEVVDQLFGLESDMSRIGTRIAGEPLCICHRFVDYNFYKNVVDGKGKFVGYPSVDGKGITAAATHSLSILASSDYKDEAWEIIKSFYTEEGQTALINSKGVEEYGLPMMKRVFDKMGSDSVTLINEAYDYARKDPEMGDHYHIVYFPADTDAIEPIG